jgi:hypothetical protein
MTRHRNSAVAYAEEQATGRVGERAQRILEAAQSWPGTGRWTDREMMEYLRLPDMNAVRPRITELVAAGLLVECGRAEDHVTGKRVRTCCVPGRVPAAPSSKPPAPPHRQHFPQPDRRGRTPAQMELVLPTLSHTRP